MHPRANNLKEAASNMLQSKRSVYTTPDRLTDLLQENQFVGDKLVDIQAGTITIAEAIHSEKEKNSNAKSSDKPPMTIPEVIEYLSTFISELHQVCINTKRGTYIDI